MVETSRQDTGPQPAAPAVTGPSLTSEEVWRHLEKATFVVLSHVTPQGEPRSSGVLATVVDRHLFVVTATDGWKSRHIARDGRVAVTVPVRRGGLLSLVAPIPPATISFHGTAVVHPPDSARIPDELVKLIPPERRSSSCVVEIEPEGMFVTYGIGVSLLTMRDTAASRARVPVVG